MTQSPSRSGFVAIIGAPNAGKSTLVNALVGEKITIVTHKIQTTRFNVRGIAMVDDDQLVLVDTPGIFSPKQRLDRSMVHAAWTGAGDADAIVHVVDAGAFYAVKSGEGSGQDKNAVKDALAVQKNLKNKMPDKPVFLALNKIDMLPQKQLLPMIETFSESGLYREIFLISAANGAGVDDLAHAMAAVLPEGPYLYSPDQAADIPSRLLAAEITREKLFLRLHNELPYASHVETESWQVKKDDSIRIEQAIFVKRGSQKSIVLGKNGQTIKQIGQLARTEMAKVFEAKVHLFLFVKVREKWAEDRSKYLETGLEFDV